MFWPEICVLIAGIMRACSRILCLAIVSLIAHPSMAQDGYVPPPMFDDSLRPETTTGNIVEPRVSPREGTVAPVPAKVPAETPPGVAPQIPVAPAAPKFMQPIVEGQQKPKVETPEKPVVEKAQAPKPSKSKTATSVTPPKKPEVPKIAAKVDEASAKNSDAAPAPPLAKQASAKPDIKAPKAAGPKPQPASKVTSKGVVTGPKTMPAVPAQAVEAVDLAAPLQDEIKANEPTILERHQNEQAKAETPDVPSAAKAADAIAAAQAAGVAPAEFETGVAQNVLKKILPYAPGQTELGQTDLTAIGAGILKELDKRDNWRIQIRSYATSQGEGVSSDKRIALSRAIALRHSLVKQGVRASRIDVRAEGQQPAATGLSPDRIDLYLYSPTEKPQIF